MNKNTAPPSAPLVCGEAVAEVVEAEGFYGVGGWVEQPADARKVRGLNGVRGLPIGTKLYLARQPAAVDAAMPALVELVAALTATGTVTGGRIYFPERQTRELLKKARDALATKPGGNDDE